MLRIIILNIILWSSLCVFFTESVTNFGTCQSPNNDSGLCLHLSDCEYIKNMTINLEPMRNSKEREFVQRSQCGIDNTQTQSIKKVLVCCPDKYCKNSSLAADETLPGNVLPRAGSCGSFLENKIFSGNRTELDEFPWMALLEYEKPDNLKGHHCGGSLINSRYVLTAAHCINGKLLPENWTLSRVRLGEWDQNTNPDCAVDKLGVKKECARPHIDIDIERSIVHELYDRNSIHQITDIGLLRLAEYVSYNIFVKPICLPLAEELRSSQFVGQTMEVSGWGQTLTASFSPIKLKANVNGWSLNGCQDIYKTFNYVLNETQLCAGGEKDIDTCGGDSGGPLMVKEKLGQKNIYFIVGIVSYGPTPCGRKGWPGVYTKVGSFVNWIQDKLEP